MSTNKYESLDFDEESGVESIELKRLELSVKELLNPPLVEELIKAEQSQMATLEKDVESERQRAESEHQRAENERQRAEKLAQRLQEIGINPEEID